MTYRSATAATAVLLLASLVAAQPRPRPLGNPTYPQGNGYTQQKAVLGKMLFFEEQLSSDNTMACATCHDTRTGGSETRLGRHPGRDRRNNTADDVFGSPGVIHSDSKNDYTPHSLFSLQRQVTRRATMPVVMAAYSPRLFWDGRAGSTFRNPETNAVSLQGGAALESQSVQPILDSGEMGHLGRTWTQVTSKLAKVTPMAIASNLTSDIQSALASNKTYPDLFKAAFGDNKITAERIAFAIATYERTLVPNQTPWDRHAGGSNTALTRRQRDGLNVLVQQCGACHGGTNFTDNQFHSIGLRPIVEDSGRQEVTNQRGDRGRFRTPTLRNAVLKKRFMHTGQFTTLDQVLNHYVGNNKVRDNLDRRVRDIRLNSTQRRDLLDFLTNGLVDARVKNGTAPFDKPTLRSERPLNVEYGKASPANNPPILIHTPTYRGAADFKVGMANALGGANCLLVVAESSKPNQASQPTVYLGAIPLNARLSAAVLLPANLGGSGAGNGRTTLHVAIPNDINLKGLRFHAQGFVSDTTAPGGLAATKGYEVVID